MKVEKLLADALLKGVEKGKTIEVTIQAPTRRYTLPHASWAPSRD